MTDIMWEIRTSFSLQKIHTLLSSLKKKRERFILEIDDKKNLVHVLIQFLYLLLKTENAKFLDSSIHIRNCEAFIEILKYGKV